MAFIFSMRTTPVNHNSMHQRNLTSTTNNSSLPGIAEDSDSFFTPQDAPPVPQRAANRPLHTGYGLSAPQIFAHESRPPPQYSLFDGSDVEGPHGEKLETVRKEFRNNKHIAKRGGWKKLVLIALVILLCLVGLIVGLVVGLRKNKGSSSQSESSNSGGSSSGENTGGGASGTVEPNGPINPATNSTTPNSNSTFPAGSYRLDTYLSTVATDCTSNPATWTCYPYSTYAQSRSGSAATFDWIISPVAGTDNYTVSSSPNPFSIVFSNASMTLQKAGTDQEHYFFSTFMNKPTKPGQLGSENVASTCTFNSTTFHAYLYTKMAKSYPNNSTETSSSDPFAPWPYAVKVEQVAAAGAGTPDCVDPSGNSLGDFSVADGSQLCDCLYLNTGT